MSPKDTSTFLRENVRSFRKRVLCIMLRTTRISAHTVTRSERCWREETRGTRKYCSWVKESIVGILFVRGEDKSPETYMLAQGKYKNNL